MRVLQSIGDMLDKPRITHDQLAALAAVPTRVQMPPPAPKTTAEWPYTFRHTRDGVTTEAALRTHAEFVAFVNWFYDQEAAPLAALEPEAARIL